MVLVFRFSRFLDVFWALFEKLDFHPKVKNKCGCLAQRQGLSSKWGLDPESTHKTRLENRLTSEGVHVYDTWQKDAVFRLLSHIVPPEYKGVLPPVTYNYLLPLPEAIGDLPPITYKYWFPLPEVIGDLPPVTYNYSLPLPEVIRDLLPVTYNYYPCQRL